MVLYWFFYNVFTMGQQLYMLRRYHEPLSFADAGHVITDDAEPAPKSAKTTAALSANGAGAKKSSSRPNSSRSKRKNKKGA